MIGMVEVKITYETLFDLLRRERSRNELQDLEKTFYDDVRAYLTEKEEMLTSTGKYTSRAEIEKIKIQIKNAKKIISELYETREKKIMHLASSKVKTNSLLLKTSTLLDKEKELFEKAVELLSQYKEQILVKIKEDNVYDNHNYEASKKEDKTKTVESAVNKTNTLSDQVSLVLNTNLPKFVGLDKKIYGPYNKGDEIKLPNNIAQLLLEKGRASKA